MRSSRSRRLMKANHQQVLRRLKIIQGQVGGLIGMVEEDRYCLEISNQILACLQSLKEVNRLVLSAHLDHCLKEAMAEGPEAAEEKLKEINQLLQKLSR